MFKDTKEGKTHSYNDGCGEPAHNHKLPKEIEERFDKEFPLIRETGIEEAEGVFFSKDDSDRVKSLIATILDEEKVRILQERDMIISMCYRNWKRRPLADKTDFDDVIAKLSI